MGTLWIPGDLTQVWTGRTAWVQPTITSPSGPATQKWRLTVSLEIMKYSSITFC